MESIRRAGGGRLRVLLVSRAMVAASHRGRARELVRLGVELTVVTPDRWEYQPFEPDLEDGGYELLVSHAALAWRALGSLAHHLFYYEGISAIARRKHWDLIHIDEEPFNFACYQTARSLRTSGSPVVFTTWQNLRKRYPPPFAFFETYVFGRAAGAIPGNAEVSAILRGRGFKKPVAVIPVHGVDPTMYRKCDVGGLRRRLRIEDTFTVGFLGRLCPEKGVDTLIKAISLLPVRCSLVLVGDGPERTRLQAIVQSLGLEERVRWVPWVASDEVSEYLNAFDVLVLPSRTWWNWKEQFGRVLIEAMACETCVIGSDSGEIPSVIGDAGLTFHEGDETELAKHIGRLSDDPCFRETMARRGRERVLDHFTHAKVAQDTLAFYQRVCASSMSDLAAAPYEPAEQECT